ncbi:MAG: stage II sporulation protein M [Anaerolineae bacterium]
MNLDEFTESRQATWQALSDLLDYSQRSLTRLNTAEVRRLGSLYRAVTSDLALAQRDFPQSRVTRYLNQLVGRAHAFIYRDEPFAIRRLRRFISHDYPSLFRESLPYFLIAFTLFMVPAILAGLAVWINQDAAYLLLPTSISEQLVPLVEGGELWIDISPEQSPAVASFIARNNIQVTFLAFAGGMLAGLLTIYAMVFNGLLIGGLMGLTTHYGLGGELANFVIGHGVVELTVIFMAGGAGLMIGWAIINPGLKRRGDAIIEAAGKAVLLIVGCVPLLLVAGMIEGFISDSALPWPGKWAVGLLSGVLLYGYLLFSGRSDQDEPAEDDPFTMLLDPSTPGSG